MYVGNEHSKRLVVGERGTLTTPTAFAAAFLTGVPESICVTPFEAVKCRMQARENASRYAHSWQCARTMVATEGAASLYSGFYATIGRNCVFNAFYFGSIFFAKENLMEAPRTVSEQVAQSLATGLLGGLVATAFKMPFDVVKSRMQSRVPDVKTGRAEYAGVTDAFSKWITSDPAYDPNAPWIQALTPLQSLELTYRVARSRSMWLSALDELCVTLGFGMAAFLAHDGRHVTMSGFWKGLTYLNLVVAFGGFCSALARGLDFGDPNLMRPITGLWFLSLISLFLPVWLVSLGKHLRTKDGEVYNTNAAGPPGRVTLEMSASNIA